MNYDYSEDFLSLIDDFIFQYDSKTKTFDFFRKQKNTICTNASLEEFTDSLFSYFDIQPYYKSFFIPFLDELLSKPTSFQKGIKLISNSYAPIFMDFNGSTLIERIEKDTIVPKKTLGIIKTNIDYSVDTNRAFDKLTGTLHIDDIFSLAMEDINTKQTPNVTLMISELTNMDELMKKYGQDIYEKVLSEVGDLIKQRLKLCSETGRIGETTFLTVIQGIHGKQEIWNLIRALFINLEDLSNYSLYSDQIYLNTGSATFPYNGKDFETVFTNASKALQKSKSKKFESFVIFNEEMHSHFVPKLNLYTKDFAKYYNYGDEKDFLSSVVSVLLNKTSFLDNTQKAASMIGQQFDFDVLTILKIEPEDKNMEIIHQWSKSDDFPLVQNFYYDNYFPLKKLITNDELFICDDIKYLIDVNYNLFKILLNNKVKTLIIQETTLESKTNIAIIIHSHKQLNLSKDETYNLSMLLKIFNSSIVQEIENIEHNKALYYDPITSIYNGTKFLMESNALIQNMPDQTYGIIATNFYNFKFINEKYGFEEGDMIISEYANLIKSIVKSGSIYCRSSADKFLILIQDTSKEEVENYIRSLNAKIKLFTTSTGEKLTLSLLTGAYIFTPSNQSMSSIIDCARFARGTLTHTNKSQYAFYEKELIQDYINQNNLESKMVSALENEEFEVYLQPKFNIKTNTVVGCEALIRWNYDDNQILSPSSFVPLFEKNGFITQIDLFVLETACKLLEKWKRLNYELIPISINISRVHIQNPTFISNVIEILKKYDVPSKYIEFELTESIFVEDINALTEIIDNFKTLGAKVSIDDFGSGYSNFNLLSNVNIDTIKLDKSLFNLETDKDKIIVESIVNLATKLKVNTISEGIETNEQKEFLESIGCDFVQGYIYSKPIKINEFEEKYINQQNKN